MKLRKVIKRIVALGAGATMLGATVLGAMAAADLSSYPKPMFIKDGKFNGLIVIGADADTQDMLGAMDIISSLQAVAVSGSNSGTAATVSTVGDVYKFEKSSDKLNMGELMSAVRNKLSKDQLPILLANGKLTTAKGSSYDYEQEVSLNVQTPVVFFADKDYKDEQPTVGIKIARNAPVINYSLQFTRAAKSANTSSEMVDFEDRTIEMLGEVYDIMDTDLTGTNIELNLMRGALKPTLEEGETQTYKINGKDYEVTALIIDDTNDKVKFKVNGEVTDSMAVGDVYEVSDGTLIGVRELMPNEAGDVTQDMVEFYIGAKKIDLANGDEVELDDEDITNLNSYITLTSGTTVQLDKITLEWKAEDDLFITEDNNEVVMPGLESLKFYMDGFYKGKQEKVKIYGSADDTITVDAPLKDYDVKLDVLFASSPSAGVFTHTGGSSTKQLVTDTCRNAFVVDMDDDQYFIVTKANLKEGQSEVLQLTKTHDVDGITIKDYDGNVVAENKKEGRTFDAADMTVTVNNISQTGSWANLSITDTSCRNSTLITKEGLRITLPTKTFNNNLSGNPTKENASYVFGIAAEDKDENIAGGYGGTGGWKICDTPLGPCSNTSKFADIAVNVTFNSDNDAHASLVAKTNLSGKNTFSVGDTKVYVGMVNSSVSTKVTEDKVNDQNEVDLEYPGEETYANLYIGSKASKVTNSAGGESVITSKIEVGTAVLDSSLASYTNQNLIVVGGPAINRASAALLGKTYPAYGADSGIPENAGLIKLVEQTDGTVAMIVAGWEADDTQRACRVVAEYDQYALSGAEVQVTGTSFTDMKVGVPAVA